MMTIEDKIMEYMEFVSKTMKTINKQDFTVSRLGIIDILSKDGDVKRIGWTPAQINDTLRNLVIANKLAIVGEKRMIIDPLGNQLYTIDKDNIPQLHIDNNLTIPKTDEKKKIT